MEFDIYSIGDSEFLEQVLIALAMIAGVDDFGAMVQVGMAVGVLSAIFSAIAKGGKEIEFQHILLGYILWATMFVPTARVTIEDTYTGDIRVVDNVPIGPAAAGGIISLVGFKVTELFEVAYGPIVPKVTETEFAESLRIINRLRNKASNEAVWNSLNVAAGGGFIDLQESWINYIKDCTLKKIDTNIINLSELYRLPYDDALRFDSFLGTQVFLEAANPNGQNVTCLDAFPDLTAATNYNNVEVQNTFNEALGLNGNNTQAGVTHIAKTQSALDALFGAGEDAQRMMETAVLEPILMRAAQGKYDALNDVAGSAMVNQAIHQRNTTWATEQSLFMSIVRPMLAFFEAFTYAVAPVMAFVIVLGAKGIQLAAKYFTLMIWIQLWMPLLAICNLYIYTASRRELDVYAASGTHNWDSFYALNGAAETAQNWIATGGMLASSTPAIALMLIYGSAVTATHLAGRLKSGAEIDPTTGGSPDLMKQGPVLGANVGYQGDMTSGVVRSGAQGDDYSLTLGQQYTSLASSSRQASETALSSFQQGIGASIRNSDGQSFNMEKVSSLGESAASMSGEERAIFDSAMQTVSDRYGQSFANDSKVQGMVAGTIAAGASLPKAVPILDAHANAQYTSTDTASNSERISRDQMTSQLESIDSRSGQKAAFTSQLATQLSESVSTGKTLTWGNEQTASSAESYVQSSQLSESYTEQASKASSMGLGSSYEGNKIARAIASNPEELNQLRGSFNALQASNPGLLDAYNSTYDRAEGMERFADPKQTEAYSLVRALTDNSAYLHQSSNAEGLSSVLNAMDGSMVSARTGGAHLAGNENENSGIGMNSPSSIDSPYSGPLGAPSIPSTAPIAPSNPITSVTPGNAANAVDSFSSQGSASVASHTQTATSNLDQFTGSATSSFTNAAVDGLITDFNQDHKLGDVADNSLGAQAEGASQRATSSVSTFTSSGWEGLTASTSEFGQQIANIKDMTPEQINDFNNSLESQFQNAEGFGAFAEGAKQAGMTSAGFLQNMVMGGAKPEEMSYAAYAQYNDTATKMALASGSEAFSAHSAQLADNAYQSRLTEAVQAGLPSGSNIAEMYASSTALGQSEQFSNALNAMKMEFVPENVDSNGYEYSMVDGEMQYATNDAGERIQHFSNGVNEHGHQAITLTNQKYEDYTNNAASTVQHASWFGTNSDSEGGMLRLAQVESIRK
ncbi:conjugal transfer protein TraG N-terminal domain-containing protein [uncultured Methylophaga sp.]|uniref:conjugal transfer protein TraG N-terminal domain-containing protein n=1 Tax=uncultured Methylophaga sp. TaxID=285271 RepID=UPI00259D2249|nr:conjugal transfer protein TraG N-terminal domain-containing protein [uncultured Methylophaga sp.]|tara:strand:+ start:47035 stop:50634 length:3600 start_codon:yes stop_codon:yes gene_type:complete